MSSAQAPLEVLPTSTMTEKQVVKGAGTEKSGSNAPAAASKSNYKGFVAGVFSGIAKLSGEFFWVILASRVLIDSRGLGVLVSASANGLSLKSFSWTSVRHSRSPLFPIFPLPLLVARWGRV